MDLQLASIEEELSSSSETEPSKIAPSFERSSKAEQRQQLLEARQSVEKGMKDINERLHLISDERTRRIILGILKIWNDKLFASSKQKNIVIEELLALELPTTFKETQIATDAVVLITLFCRNANRNFKQFSKTYAPYQGRPTPSSFAVSWAEPQGRFDDLLCKRPNKRTGLPLATLHEVFGNYQR
ncbi:hypothetical protein BDN70DRAFT_927943 [Pholiota conissans]|uniref:Uncharacterized protein n=1 Tax=Pholiota conissans TaxID=109636 RepID=A0A9P5ZFF9_9AGAR|nr:hypothetical protein BDN70DRAFT_927943 [Pholiota conissans]